MSEVEIKSATVMCACCLDQHPNKPKLIFNQGGVLIFEIQNPNPEQSAALFHLTWALKENQDTPQDVPAQSVELGVVN